MKHRRPRLRLSEQKHIETRRTFLATSGTALAAAFVAPELLLPLSALPEFLGGSRRSENMFYPENYDFDLNNAGPAIQAALDDASIVGGTVELGAGPWYNNFYRFRTIIYVRPGTTLKGSYAAIQLLNDGGYHPEVGFPTRIEMQTQSWLHSLHIAMHAEPALPVQPDTLGVTTWAAENSWIYNCQVSGFPFNGLHLIDTVNFHVNGGCYIHNNGKVGIQVIRGSGGQIAQNDIYWNGLNGVDLNSSGWFVHDNDCSVNGQTLIPEEFADRNGILVPSVGGTNAHNNLIQGNRCELNKYCGILVSGGPAPHTQENNTIYANRCSNNVVGIQLQGDCCGVYSAGNQNTGLTVNNNMVTSNSQSGFKQHGSNVTYIEFKHNYACGHASHLQYDGIWPTPDSTNLKYSSCS